MRWLKQLVNGKTGTLGFMLSVDASSGFGRVELESGDVYCFDAEAWAKAGTRRGNWVRVLELEDDERLGQRIVDMRFVDDPESDMDRWSKPSPYTLRRPTELNFDAYVELFMRLLEDNGDSESLNRLDGVRLGPLPHEVLEARVHAHGYIRCCTVGFARVAGGCELMTWSKATNFERSALLARLAGAMHRQLLAGKPWPKHMVVRLEEEEAGMPSQVTISPAMTLDNGSGEVIEVRVVWPISDEEEAAFDFGDREQWSGILIGDSSSQPLAIANRWAAL